MLTFNHHSGQTLQVDDAEIYYELTGNKTGPAWVLLHGGLGNLTDFNDLLNCLPDYFSVIGIDLRGHGKSTLGTESLSYHLHLQDIEAVLEYLKVEQFLILGFSDGGVVAYKIAIKHPKRIKTLISIGAHHNIDPQSGVFSSLSRVTAHQWKNRFPKSVSYYLANNLSPNFEKLVTEVVAMWTDIEGARYPGSTIDQIISPTLIVRGDNEHLFSLNDALDLQQRINDASLFNIPNAGHEAHKDATMMFLHGVRGFLKGDL